MALRSVLDIEVNSGAFDAFHKKFTEYQAAAANQAPLQMAAKGATQGADSAKSLVKSEQDKATQQLEKQTRFAEQLKRSWNSMRDDTKHVARSLTEMTSSMLRFTSLMGLASGMATGFGFLGMDKLAGSAASWRRSSMGLGTSIGGQRSFALNFGRAFDTDTVLKNTSEAMRDPSKRKLLASMGVSFGENEDSSDVAVRLANEVRRQAKNTSEQNLGSFVSSHGLEGTFSTQDVQRMRSMSDEEWAAQNKHQAADRKDLDLAPGLSRQWTDFKDQLSRAGMQIETIFVKGLTKLATPLSHLSDAAEKTIASLLDMADKSGFIDVLAKAVDSFADYVKTPEFKEGIKAFADGVVKAGKELAQFVSWVSTFMPNVDDPLGAKKTDLDTKPTGSPTADGLNAVQSDANSAGKWLHDKLWPNWHPFGGGGTTSPTTAEQSARSNEGIDYFKSKGWTPEQAAGLMGSFQQESSFNPQAGVGTAHVGIAQWSATRQADIAAHFGKPVASMSYQEQLAAAQWELTEGKYKNVGDELRATKTGAQSSYVVTHGFEAPGNYDKEDPLRAANTQARLDAYAQAHATTKAQVAATVKPDAAAADAATPGPAPAWYHPSGQQAMNNPPRSPHVTVKIQNETGGNAVASTAQVGGLYA
jgi:hypothetical protein